MTPDLDSGFGVLTFDYVEESSRAQIADRLHALSGRKPGAFGPARTLSMGGHMTADQLCRVLEGMLGRPVIDDSGAGHGSFKMEFATDNGIDGLLAALRDQFGLALTPERRQVEW